MASNHTHLAEDVGCVMSISLKDVLKSTIGFQAVLQGAGTPNKTGLGGSLLDEEARSRLTT